MSSSALTLASNAVTSITVRDNSWTNTVTSVTNATINLALGAVTAIPSATTAVLNTGTLNVSGTNVINITSGSGLTPGVVKLIDYTSSGNRFGGGSAPLPLLELDFCEQDGGDPHFFSFGVINQSRYDQKRNRRSWNAGRWVIEDAPDTSAEFHVWACEFTPETTRFYFDGRLTKAISSAGFPHDEMNVWFSVIASTLKGDRWVDESKLPNAVLCDYMRVYQHPK